MKGLDEIFPAVEESVTLRHKEFNASGVIDAARKVFS